MSLKLPQLPEPVARALRAYHRRRRLYTLARVLVLTLTLYLLLALLAMHLDRLLFLSAQARAVLLWSVHGLSALAGVLGLAVFFGRRPSAARIAAELEAALGPDAAERYVTLENVARRPEIRSDPLTNSLLVHLEESAARHSQSFRARRLVRDRKLPWFTAIFLAVVGLYALLGLQRSYELPLMARRFFAPHGNLPKASFVKLQLTPEQALVGQGDEIAIRAEVQGRIPPLLAWLYRAVGSSSERAVIALANPSPAGLRFAAAAHQDMTRVQRDLFLFAQQDLQETLDFQIRCGDAQSAICRVEVAARPRVTHLQITITPPAYTGQPAQTITNLSRPVFLLKNTQVSLRFQTQGPVGKQELIIDREEEPMAPQWDAATGSGQYDFVLREKTTIKVFVANQVQGREFPSKERAEATLGLRPDRPPAITTDAPEGEMELAITDALPLRLLAEDDLGVAYVGLVYAINPDRATEKRGGEIKLEQLSQPTASLTLTAHFDLAQTKAQPGDVVLLQAAARDWADNLGLSRPLRIRVAATTRGEDERRRLAALRFLSQALDRITYSAVPAGGDPAAALLIEPRLHEQLQEQAKDLGVALNGPPNMASYLRALEIEQHFTDSSLYKQDLRMLHMVLQAACAPLPAPAGSDPYTARNHVIANLLGDVVPELTQYRRVKNVLVLLLGLKQEARDLAQAMAQLEPSQHPDAVKVQAIDRRAQLAGEMLAQRLHKELLGPGLLPASVVPASIKERLKQAQTAAQGMLDSKAAQAKNAAAAPKPSELLPMDTGDEGGSWEQAATPPPQAESAPAAAQPVTWSQRRAAAEQLERALLGVVEDLRPALPELLATEAGARTRLDKLYQSAWQQIVAGPPASGDAARWRTIALRFLVSDARLMDEDPFQPLGPRLLRWGLARCLAAVPLAGKDEEIKKAEAEQAKLMAQLLNPGEPFARAAAADQAWMGHLGAAWQTQALQQAGNLSAGDRALLAALLQLEWAQQTGPGDPAAKQRLLALNLAQPPAQVPAQLLATPWPGGQPADLGAALADWRQAAATSLPLASSLEELQHLADLYSASDAALASMTRFQAANDYQNLALQKEQTIAALERQRHALRLLIDGLVLRLTLLQADQGDPPAEDWLLLKLREIYDLPPVEVGVLLTTADVAGLVRVAVDDVKSPDADYRLLRTLHVAIANRIKSLVNDVRDQKTPSQQELDKLALWSSLVTTRRYLQHALALQPAAADAPAVGRAFLHEFEEANLEYLGQQQPLLTQLAGDIELARSRLSAPTPPAAFAEAAGVLQQRLAKLRGALALAAPGSLLTDLEQSARKLDERASRLTVVAAGNAPAQAGQRLYDLDQIAQELARIEQNLAGALQGVEDAKAPFQGGPEEIWEERYWYDTRHSQKRLLSQARQGRQELIVSLLGALAQPPRTQDYPQALGQAAFLYRLVRSDLASPRRPLRSRSERPNYDRVGFLLAELEKALKNKDITLYAGPTMSYLDFIGANLRK